MNSYYHFYRFSTFNIKFRILSEYETKIELKIIYCSVIFFLQFSKSSKLHWLKNSELNFSSTDLKALNWTSALLTDMLLTELHLNWLTSSGLNFCSTDWKALNWTTASPTDLLLTELHLNWLTSSGLNFCSTDWQALNWTLGWEQLLKQMNVWTDQNYRSVSNDP